MSDTCYSSILEDLLKKRGSPKYSENNEISTNFRYNLSFQSKQGSAVDTRNLHKTLVHSGALWLVTIYTEIVSIKLYFGILLLFDKSSKIKDSVETDIVQHMAESEHPPRLCRK